MDDFKIDFKGMKGVEKAFEEIGASLSEKVVVGALRDAAKPVHQAMVAAAPVGDKPTLVKDIKSLNKRLDGAMGIWVQPGQLRERIKIRSKKAVSSRTGKVAKRTGKGEVARVRVGVFRAYYLVFKEFGTKDEPAQPFIRPAIERNTGLVIQTFSSRIHHRIKLAKRKLEREAKKNGK